MSWVLRRFGTRAGEKLYQLSSLKKNRIQICNENEKNKILREASAMGNINEIVYCTAI